MKLLNMIHMEGVRCLWHWKEKPIVSESLFAGSPEEHSYLRVPAILLSWKAVPFNQVGSFQERHALCGGGH